MSDRSSFSQWRLLEDGIQDPFLHFAVEEALLRKMDEGVSPPTLRLRQVIPSVWIGIYQYAEEDVDVEHCQQNKIPIVRRPNPGGAVYQDKGCFCYSAFFVKEPFFQHLGISDPSQLYPIFGQAVVRTCADFGVKAELSPVNDVSVGGRKIYGSAQIALYSAFVHSGTFLINTDREQMERVLKPSKLKFSDKGFQNVKDRVINLSEAAGKDIPIPTAMEKLVYHISRVLQIDLVPAPLSEEENALAQELYISKYAQPEWTFKKKGNYSSVVSTKAKSGVITLETTREGEKFVNLSIKGDFLIPDQQELNRLIHGLQNKNIQEATSMVHSSSLPVDVREALVELLTILK